jgi:hypothetical protein
MKFLEIDRGWVQPVSNEEMILLQRVRGSDGICAKKELNEREQEVARLLCLRGVLTRVMRQGVIHYGYQEPVKK